MKMIKNLIRSTLLIAILWPLSVSAEWTNLLPGSNITLQEVYNGNIQTTTIYCSTAHTHEPRVTFSIQQQGDEYHVIMNGYTVDIRYFFNSAINTIKALMEDINSCDIMLATCNIQRVEGDYHVLIGQDVAHIHSFFQSAKSTMAQLRQAGICR